MIDTQRSWPYLKDTEWVKRSEGRLAEAEQILRMLEALAKVSSTINLMPLVNRTRELITTLENEAFALAANQCVHRTGLIGDDGGTPICPVTFTPDAMPRWYHHRTLDPR